MPLQKQLNDWSGFWIFFVDSIKSQALNILFSRNSFYTELKNITNEGILLAQLSLTKIEIILFYFLIGQDVDTSQVRPRMMENRKLTMETLSENFPHKCFCETINWRQSGNLYKSLLKLESCAWSIASKKIERGWKFLTLNSRFMFVWFFVNRGKIVWKFVVWKFQLKFRPNFSLDAFLRP